MEWRLLASVSLEIIVWLILQAVSLLTCLYFTHYLESFKFVKSIAQLAMGLAQPPIHPLLRCLRNQVNAKVIIKINIYLYIVFAY